MSVGPLVAKMSAAGNDFVVVGPAAAADLPEDRTAWIRRVCRRRLSVGADGVLFVEPRGGQRVSVVFHNPDGTRAFCGNGSRCAARFAHDRGWAGESMVLETFAGDVPARVDLDRVTLRLPVPQDRGRLSLDLPHGGRVEGRWIVAGVPHFLISVDAVGDAPLDVWGPRIRRHARLGAEGANVDVVSALHGGRLHVRTWERGVEGETLACGSAAVAAGFAAATAAGVRALEIVPASGIPLEVGVVEGDDEEAGGVTLSGDARRIFEGRLGAEATCGFPD